MIYFFSISLLFSSALPDTLPELTADTLFTINKKHEAIYTDKLDNIYVINHDVITRYQSNGDSLLQQSFKKFGDVEFFDATQALRPVLFYASQSLALTIDNTLSLQNEPIELSQFGFEQCTLMAASSFNDGFWLFDNGILELVRVNHTFKIINRSGNLTTALNQATVPKLMKERNNRLYMYMPNMGIAVFDQYANYLKTLPILSLLAFDVYGDMIYFLDKDDLFQYDMQNFTTTKVTNTAAIKAFTVNGDRLCLGNGSSISVIRFK